MTAITPSARRGFETTPTAPMTRREASSLAPMTKTGVFRARNQNGSAFNVRTNPTVSGKASTKTPVKLVVFTSRIAPSDVPHNTASNPSPPRMLVMASCVRVFGETIRNRLASITLDALIVITRAMVIARPAHPKKTVPITAINPAIWAGEDLPLATTGIQ